MAEFTQSVLDAIRGIGVGSAESTKPRMILTMAAPTGHGKTHWALSAPKPLVYLGLETGGSEGVLVPSKFNLKGVRAAYYPFMLPTGTDRDKEAQVMPHARLTWEKFAMDYRALLRTPGIRSIVVDTFSECYDLCKLARLGTLAPFPRETVAKVNRELLELAREAFGYDKNLIMLQHLKDEWINNASTGRKIARGTKELDELVQVNIRMERVGKQRIFTINKCRPNEALFGEVIPDMDFATLGGLAFPDQPSSVWED